MSTAIFELFAGKDQSLLIWGNSLLVLNLGLDIFDGVRSLHFQSNGLAGLSHIQSKNSMARSPHHVSWVWNAKCLSPNLVSPSLMIGPLLWIPPARRPKMASSLMRFLAASFSFLTCALVGLVLTKICIPPLKRRTKCKVD